MERILFINNEIHKLLIDNSGKCTIISDNGFLFTTTSSKRLSAFLKGNNAVYVR